MLSKGFNLIYTDEVDDVLRKWRSKAVTILFYVTVVIVLPAFIITAISMIRVGTWQELGIMGALYLLLILLAVFKRLDYRLRGYGFLAAGYVMAIVNFINLGLLSSGRIYLITMPVIGLILIGIRTGWIMTALSLLIYGIYSLFAYTGILVNLSVPLPEHLDMSMLIISGSTMMMLLVIIISLLMRMYHFLINALKTERRLSTELLQTYEETLEGWARALELRDIETAGHCHRVSEMTKRLAKEVGIGDDEILDLHRGSLLHDIGKMGIPDSILLKPDKLSNEEFKHMQQHTTYAYDLLSHIPYLSKTLDIPYCHHEKWDGSGYPRQLKEREIPLPARIFSVVDVYDALTSDRPYRRAWPEKKALAYIEERAGTEFDPVVVKAFIKLVKEEKDSSNAS